jgi:hypothetical protein
MGRCRSLTEKQVIELRECLENLKRIAQETESGVIQHRPKHVPDLLIKV